MNPDDIILIWWIKLLVREQALTKDATELSREVFLAVNLQSGEAWRNVVARLLRNFRAGVVDPYRPHILEAGQKRQDVFH